LGCIIKQTKYLPPAAVKVANHNKYLINEQVQVDNNDEQQQGEIIGELKEDVEQKISNNDKLTSGGNRGYKLMTGKEKPRRDKMA
jgi:hypothetical protein